MDDITTAASDSRQHQRTVEGCIDALDGTRLRGWAWMPASPDARPVIEVRANGKLLAKGTADALRADLVAAGKGDGRHAFTIVLKSPPEPGTQLDVTALFEGRREPLLHSPWTTAAPAPRTSHQPDVFPMPLQGGHLEGSLDQCGPVELRGWALFTDGRRELPELALYEEDSELARCKADSWRYDIARHFDHDGYCGFDVRLPGALRDGQRHTLDVRLVATGESLLRHPVRVRTAGASTTQVHMPPPLGRPVVDKPLALTIIVNFYNMRREAERTLAALGRGYQRDVNELDYEVLCIDNGSNPPLDAAWVAGFGPEFRLIRPQEPAASPCAALNAAALAARGRYVALMIDGAHVLTPGVLREALAAWREDAHAVVAVRHWFVGGDQRWLATAGYQREMEDRLFERIHWPANGYELFRIGAPIGESPEPWFDGLPESNCLMMPTKLFDRIGGFDTAFTEPGGGFANLDLWRRASDAAAGTLVSLVGEASFHQFHEGTTTNVHDDEKDVRVRRYARTYQRLRGQEFVSVPRKRLHFRGRIHAEHATGVRQRTLLPMEMAITGRVRVAEPERHFDAGAQRHLQSCWAEGGFADEVTWSGQPTGVAASDLAAIQKIVHEQHPDAVVTVRAEPGLVHFLAAVLAPAARIICVGTTPAALPAGRAQCPNSLPNGTRALDRVARCVGGAENVLVVLACPQDTSLEVQTLRDWGALVSHRSWLICTGTLFGQPWLGYATQHHLTAIRDFVAAPTAPFVIDRGANRQWLTACPDGFLRKTGGSLALDAYDPSLDTLPASGPAEHTA